MIENDGDNFRPVPDCPRCGYELVGHPTLSGPGKSDTGQCPECGLIFAWARLFNPVKPPSWLVESERRWLVLSAISTMMRSLFPWSFWKKIELELPRNMWRAFVGVIIGFFMLWGVLAVFSIASALVFDYAASPQKGVVSVRFLDRLKFDPGGALWGIVSPTRLGFFGSNWLWTTYLAYICAPLVLLLMPRTLQNAKVLPSHIARIVLYSIAPSVVIATLPSTFRSLSWMVEVVILGNRWSTTGANFVYNSLWLRPALAFAAMLLTWGFACSRYLKLPRAWLIAFGISFLSVLLGVLAMLMIVDTRFLLQ